MKNKILIGSIIAVVILTLVSFSSVVGYQSVKSDLDISVEENKKEIVYQEKSSEEDCGCEGETKSQMDITTICWILEKAMIIPALILLLTNGMFGIMFWILEAIWILLDCRNITAVLY